MADEGMTVGLLDSVTVPLVIVTEPEMEVALDSVTVGALESVTVPDVTLTLGIPRNVVVIAEDGVMVGTEERETVPEETAMAVPATTSPMLTR